MLGTVLVSKSPSSDTCYKENQSKEKRLSETVLAENMGSDLGFEKT